MHRQTRATDIPPEVKRAVWERDGRCCVLCGSPYAAPNAHVAARSHGGLGIEENIVTLCPVCHERYDNGRERPYLREELLRYLRDRYPGWTESRVVYQKYRE